MKSTKQFLTEIFVGALIIFGGAEVAINIKEINLILGTLILGTSMLAGGLMMIIGFPGTTNKEVKV